jgi:hypothetical protein
VRMVVAAVDLFVLPESVEIFHSMSVAFSLLLVGLYRLHEPTYAPPPQPVHECT